MGFFSASILVLVYLVSCPQFINVDPKKNTISWWFCATRLKPYDRQFGAHPSQEID